MPSVCRVFVATQLTAATLVASGVPTRRVLTWQAVAIVLWTSLATGSAALSLTLIG